MGKWWWTKYMFWVSALKELYSSEKEGSKEKKIKKKERKEQEKNIR